MNGGSISLYLFFRYLNARGIGLTGRIAMNTNSCRAAGISLSSDFYTSNKYVQPWKTCTKAKTIT